ncbi:hypothetical protein ACFWB1_18105 [Streptomyces goshikiensis]|uniref:hypothetical protein n=1 Tax=Streptomyces goshikiensis TaxID=1942 RepID=UPI0036BBF9BE
MSAFTFSRWEFLTESLPAVLSECGAVIEHVPDDGLFMGGILASEETLTVRVSDGLEQLEHDLVVRGVLAAWHYVDITDWPVVMHVQGGRA